MVVLDAEPLVTATRRPADAKRRTGRGSWQKGATTADNKSERGAADRRQVAGGEGSEVNSFAPQDGISKHQAEALMKRVGTVTTYGGAQKLKKCRGPGMALGQFVLVGDQFSEQVSVASPQSEGLQLRPARIQPSHPWRYGQSRPIWLLCN
ncbi:hypothetical protein NKH52_25390 [Mesorhizobium sp. M1066]|uniref:hypothetical protein n=1 Tax=unclassified Mesorhizobium TaxID=325217 RepID=UPI00333B85F5